MKTANISEFESADELLSSIQDPDSTSTFVAMVGCMASLLLMRATGRHRP